MILSPVVIGLDVPSPGILNFQRKLSWLHCTGKSLSSATPPRAPRNPGQSAATSEPRSAERDTRAAAVNLTAAVMGYSCGEDNGRGKIEDTAGKMKGS